MKSTIQNPGDAFERFAKRPIRLDQTKCCYCVPVKNWMIILTFLTIVAGIIGILEVSGLFVTLYGLNTTAAKVLFGINAVGNIVFGAAGLAACLQCKPILMRYYLYWATLVFVFTVPFAGALILFRDPALTGIPHSHLIFGLFINIMFQLYFLYVGVLCLHQLHREKEQFGDMEDDFYLRLPLWMQTGAGESMRCCVCIPLQPGVVLLALGTMFSSIFSIFVIIFFPENEIVTGGLKSTSETRTMAFLLDILGLIFGAVGILGLMQKNASKLGLFFYYELGRACFYIPITIVNLVVGNLCGTYTHGIAQIYRGFYLGMSMFREVSSEAPVSCSDWERFFMFLNFAIFLLDCYFVYVAYSLWQVYRGRQQASYAARALAGEARLRDARQEFFKGQPGPAGAKGGYGGTSSGPMPEDGKPKQGFPMPR